MSNVATDAKKEAKSIEIADQSLSTTMLNGTRIDITSEGNVTVFTNMSIEAKPAVRTPRKDIKLSMSKDFNTISLHGTKVELTASGELIVYTNGFITLKPPAVENNEEIFSDTEKLDIGMVMDDGSIIAGVTTDGKSKIFAMPEDLDTTMTFKNATKVITKLNKQNAFGHNDWQIPNLDTLKILQKNEDKGSLKGTFNTTLRGPDYPHCYWSSTEHPDSSRGVYSVRFSSGGGRDWNFKNTLRLSCRPVRLVPMRPLGT